MLSSLTSPVIFAHRGASSHAPENTLSAFLLAVQQGAEAIELDVQLTLDQEVIVFHDSFLDRTTNGSGKVSDFSLSQIKNLNAGFRFSPSYQDERIPTLDEVFFSLPDNIFINIELKNLPTPFDNLPEKTAQLVVKHNAQNRVLISSFNSIALFRFSRILPSIPRGRLLHCLASITLLRLFPHIPSRIQSVHLPFQSLSIPLIHAFKNKGLLVFTYTLNHSEDILSAIKQGVDGFFTDDPSFAKNLISQ